MLAQDYRVMGRWIKGESFLVVLGRSANECRRGVKGALASYSRQDVNRIEFLWVERWTWDEFFEEWGWMPIEELPIKAIRTSKAMLAHHRPRADGAMIGAA